MSNRSNQVSFFNQYKRKHTPVNNKLVNPGFRLIHGDSSGLSQGHSQMGITKRHQNIAVKIFENSILDILECRPLVYVFEFFY